MIIVTKYNCVMQDEIKDCGAASLLTIIETYGGNVSMEYLRMLTNTTKSGTNAYYLLEASKSIGFDVRAVEGSIELLNKKDLPCIAHVIIDKKYKHFVVIHDISKKYIIVADPALGIKKVLIDDFKKTSTNKYLLLRPNKKIPNYKNNKDFIKKIIKNIFTHKKTIFFVFLNSFIYTLLNILGSYSFQFVIEDAINIGSFNNLYFIMLSMICFIIIKALVDYFRVELINYINYKLDFVLTHDIFKHIILLPYQYYRNKTTADIISRIGDIGSIKEALSSAFISIIDGILLIFIFIALVNINIYLSLLSLLIVILYFLVIKIFNNKLNSSISINQQEISKVNLSLIESIESVETIKGLNVENEITDRFDDTYTNCLNKNFKLLSTFNKEGLLKDLINGLGINLIILIGSLLVLKDKMTIGELITYNALVIYFLEPIKNIIDFNVQINKVKVAIRRIIDLYSINKEQLNIDKKYVDKKLDGKIDIINLSYSYNGRDKILDSVNLVIQKYQKIMLCGDSGSGKSTLVKILMKYYDIPNNVITIDEKDINDYNLLQIRRDICYVSQNEKLFTDSVYNNIVLDRNIEYNEFLKVCKITGVDKIVNKNISKYDMLLEENGFNISGGERQRIIMARSILKNANIYIFDESISQLDIESERKMLIKIFKAFSKKTIIFVSHRFDNKDLFDNICFIREGHINDKY